MFTLRDQIEIQAPIERCFLLSTSLELVQRVLRMKSVAGRTSGLVQANDLIHWQGWKFGLPQIHVSHISAFEPFTYFQDTMVKGRFAHFQHDHWLRETGNGTRLEDEVRFSLPFGPAGWLAARTIVLPHIRTLMQRRFATIKRAAEGEEWRSLLPQHP